MSKVAFVTGASSGIGAATARNFLAEGYTVYAGARRVTRMKPLESAGAHLLALDLIDDTSTRDAVERVLRETGRIDVLVNNAGYGAFGALEDVPLEEARRQFDVNVFGLARLIQLCAPTMRRQRSGKIVNVTSVAGKLHQPFGAWYHASKFAVEGMSDCLRVELAPFGIDVIIIEPGPIKTEWGDIARQSLLKYSGETDYRDQAVMQVRMLAKNATSSIASGPDIIADTILRATKAKRPKTRYAVGGGAPFILAIRRLLSDRGFDWLLRNAAKQLGSSGTSAHASATPVSIVPPPSLPGSTRQSPAGRGSGAAPRDPRIKSGDDGQEN